MIDDRRPSEIDLSRCSGDGSPTMSAALPGRGLRRRSQTCGHGSNELLDAHRELGSFLDSRRTRSMRPRSIEPPITERPGTVIGPYKLLQQIGEGGMGVVFMAEQTEPVQRTVALKIIKPGMDTRQVIARFEAERQALAMMDHPNIAKVLDAGHDRHRPALLRDGAGQRRADHQVLRRKATLAPRAAGTVHAGLPGRAARPSKRHHPSRHQADERAGGRVRRPAPSPK